MKLFANLEYPNRSVVSLCSFGSEKVCLQGTNSLRFVKEMFHKRFLKPGLLTDLPLGSDFKTLQYHATAFEARFSTFSSCSAQSSFVHWYRSGDSLHPCLQLITELWIKAMDWLYFHHVPTRLSMISFYSPSLKQNVIENCICVS